MLAGFAVAMLVLHILGGRRGHIPPYLSHFSGTPDGWLWTLGLLLFAIGTACVGASVHVKLPRDAWGMAARMLVAFVPLGALGIAIFPPAPRGAIEVSLAERLHEVSALATFAALALAMVCTAASVRRVAPRFAGSTLLIVAAIAAISPWILRGFLAGTEDVLYSERLLVMLMGCWLFAVGPWARDGVALRVA